MPTGYTAGILDGKITTFPQFAKLCMRNFGATIHMRDESFDKEYEPRKVFPYHKENIERIRKEVELLKNTSDEQLIETEKKELAEDKKRNLKNIKERKENRKKLESILKKAIEFKPPTSEHMGIRDFMIDQLKKTIDWDCDDTYAEKELKRISIRERSIDPIILRETKLADLEKDLAYHLKEYKKEVQRVDESNKWVDDFLESINQRGQAKKKKILR